MSAAASDDNEDLSRVSGSEGCGRAGAQRGRQEVIAAARLAAGGDTEI